MKIPALILFLACIPACALSTSPTPGEEARDDTTADASTEVADDAADPWALAKDVHLANVPFDDTTPIPDSYESPDTAPISLSSPEWWQRWPGGEVRTFNWSVGTDFGKRCGVASAVRLTSILNYVDDNGDMPGARAFQRLLDDSGWNGNMYNWTEDLSQGSGFGSYQVGSMWAWTTTGIKWINVVRADGSCELPTLALVEAFANECVEERGTEIQGCRRSNSEQ